MLIKRLPNRDMNQDFLHVGHRISVVRKECGLSQLELAQLIGKKSSVAICLYERGKRFPNSVTLQKIAYACAVPMAEIIC